MKLLYVVLDGAPDGFTAPKTALKEANKPNIDFLAKNSVCGLAYIVGRGIAPESDAATLSLLGYDPEKYYTGRGPIEAIGAGINFTGDKQVAIRANFATIDPVTLQIIDRRVGRSLRDDEARELAKAIDGIMLDNGRAIAYFKHTVGHRGVLVIQHSTKQLSGWITNTDPAYSRVGLISHALKTFEKKIRFSQPMKNESSAKLTARLVNEYTMKAIEILTKHPINQERIEKGTLPANAVLLRDAGHQKPDLPPISSYTGLDWRSITEMPVEKGIAILAGMHPFEISYYTEDKLSILKLEAKLVLEELVSGDDIAIYVHLKGPDEPGHDGDLEAKIKAIEDIDRHFFAPIIEDLSSGTLGDTGIIVTADHSTPWNLQSHSDDPVPVMIHHHRIDQGYPRFDEEICSSGSVGILEKGSEILPKALEILRKYSHA
ncbi:MAG: alkaline phosphatase family protein [Desulfurococcales archaeon]|nr:alkaline phosphatase family protein [Desulfurococcales archaeon]